MAKELKASSQGHIAGQTVASFREFSSELLEDDGPVGRDPLWRFVPLEEIQHDAATPWCAGNWGRKARPR